MTIFTAEQARENVKKYLTVDVKWAEQILEDIFGGISFASRRGATIYTYYQYALKVERRWPKFWQYKLKETDSFIVQKLKAAGYNVKLYNYRPGVNYLEISWK